jgi:hypothetical protein
MIRWLLSGIVLPLSIASAWAQEVASYHLPLTVKPPVLDGDLSDPCWKDALAVSSFSPLKGATIPEADRVETRALLTATKTHIYLAVICQEPLIDKLRKDVVNHDGMVWKDDSIEFYLSTASRESGRCVQISFNANGIVNDTYYPGKGLSPDEGYQSGAECKARIGKEEWVTEMAIPLNRLPIESASGPWAFQITRHRHTKPMLMTSLKTSVKGFKEFALFDELQGIEQLEIPFSLKNLSFYSPFSAGENCAENFCSFEVDGDRGQLSSVDLLVDDKNRAQIAIGPQQSGRILLPFQFTPGDVGKKMKIRVLSGENVVQEYQLILHSLPAAVIGDFLRNALYVERGGVELQLRVNKSAESGSRLQIAWSASDPAGNILGSGESPVVDRIARLPLQWEDLKAGHYAITLRLLENGSEIADAKRFIRLIQPPFENQ